MTFDWFLERVGKTVLIEGKDDTWREVVIKDDADARKHHLMSLEGYSYADIPQSPNVCISCEG